MVKWVVVCHMIRNLLNCIVLFENYFLAGIFQYLCFHKINRNYSVIMTIFLTLEAFVLACLEVNQIISLLFPALTLFVFSTYVQKSKWIHNMLCLGLCFSNLILIKGLVILFITYFTQIDLNNITMNYTIMYFMTCLSILFLSLEYFVLEYFIDIKTTLSKQSMLILCVYLILVFITIGYVLHEFVYDVISWEMCCYLIIASIIVLYLAIYLTISNSKYYEKILEQSLKLEAEEYKSKYIDLIYEKTKEYNKLQHDYKHHLNVLRYMVKDNHNLEAESYIDDLEKKKSNDLIYIDHIILNYLLNDKITFAKSFGIEIGCVVVGQVVDFISDVDYSILLGNLLDNAIEETKLVGGQDIELYIRFEDVKAIFEVKNKTHLKNGEKILKTHKTNSKKHGFGLKNIRDIVNQYHGQDIIDIHDGYFIHMCILYKDNE